MTRPKLTRPLLKRLRKAYDRQPVAARPPKGRYIIRDGAWAEVASWHQGVDAEFGEIELCS